MKLLLLGEYSGFFKNLKIGFEKLGHEVLWIAGGDGWKDIPGADVNLDSGAKGVYRKPVLLFNYYRNLHRMNGFDAVLIINPSFFKKGATKLIIDYLARNNNAIYLSACGDDYNYIRYGQAGGYRWWPFMQWEDAFHADYLTKKSDYEHLSVLMERVKAVIPTCYDYSVAWKNSEYSDLVKNIIGLPVLVVNSKLSSYIPENNKVVLFHGLNREWFKGTDLIRPALEQIRADFPDMFDVRIEGGLPYKSYLALLDRTDIVVDQCKVYSYGSMNAVLSMAKGKIVAGCAEQECLDSLNLTREKLPVIPLQPDSEYIYNSIVSSVVGEDIHTMKEKSLNYVKAYHDSLVVAQEYIDLFSG